MKLPHDAFIALAAVGWADDHLGKDEAEGILRAARDYGIAGAELAQVEAATKQKVTIAEVDTIRLSRGDRVRTFALGTWLVRVDGVVTEKEKALLQSLGDRLGLPAGIRDRAALAATDAAAASDRPDTYDFTALEARLAAKLGDIDVE